MDVLGLVGARSGKTLLNRLIIADTKLSSGDVYVKAIKVHESRSYNRFKAYKYIGYCPQQNSFDADFTGSENLEIFCLIRGIRHKNVTEVSKELAGDLNFKEHLSKQSKKYTVSDKRKLSIAIAIIGSPPLILLDEPTMGIENVHRSNVLDVLKSVNECGSAILLSSRTMEDFEALCTRLALINKGKLLSIGTVNMYKHITGGFTLLLRVRPKNIQSGKTLFLSTFENETGQQIKFFLDQHFQKVFLLLSSIMFFTISSLNYI